MTAVNMVQSTGGSCLRSFNWSTENGFPVPRDRLHTRLLTASALHISDSISGTEWWVEEHQHLDLLGQGRTQDSGEYDIRPHGKSTEIPMVLWWWEASPKSRAANRVVPALSYSDWTVGNRTPVSVFAGPRGSPECGFGRDLTSDHPTNPQRDSGTTQGVGQHLWTTSPAAVQYPSLSD